MSFKSGIASDNGSEYYKTVNNYNASEWAKMEANGAVFLPTTGYRSSVPDVFGVDSYGCYWSSTTNSIPDAGGLSFSSGNVDVAGGYRSTGRSVRLVQDAE